MRKDSNFLAVIGGLFVALFILIAVVACNNTGGGGYSYPQDHSHGYYDVHHHYHYYPKYNKGSKYYVVPSKPKSKGWSFNKGGSGTTSKKGYSGSSRRR